MKTHQKVRMQDRRTGRLVRAGKPSEARGASWWVSVDGGGMVCCYESSLQPLEPEERVPKIHRTQQAETLFPLEQFDNRVALRR